MAGLPGAFWSTAARAFPSWYEQATLELLAPVEETVRRALLDDHVRRPLERILVDPVGAGRFARSLCNESSLPRPLFVSDDSDHLLLALEDSLRTGDLTGALHSAPRNAVGAPPFEVGFDRVLCLFPLHENFGGDRCASRLAAFFDRRESLLAPGGELWWVHVLAEAPLDDERLAAHLVRVGAPAGRGWTARLRAAALRTAVSKTALQRARSRLASHGELLEAVRESRFGTVFEQAMLGLRLEERDYAQSVIWLRLRKAEVVSRENSPECEP